MKHAGPPCPLPDLLRIAIQGAENALIWALRASQMHPDGKPLAAARYRQEIQAYTTRLTAIQGPTNP